MASPPVPSVDSRVPFWRNEKIISILFQLAFALGVVLLFAFLINNMFNRLEAAGRSLNWNYLGTEAGFAIGEGMQFSPQETYGRAFLIGLVNTLRVAVIGIILATILGLFAGIARLSTNWLLSRIAGIYIEIFRSTPLLVQLFFWYSGVILSLPSVDAAKTIPGVAIISNRGVALTAVNFSAVGQPLRWWLLGAVAAALVVAWLRRRMLRRAGHIGSGWDWGVGVLIVVALAGYGLTTATSNLPANIAYELERGDRGVLYVDANQNGSFDAGSMSTVQGSGRGGERRLAFVPVTLQDAQGNALGQARTDGNGNFRFYGLPDGAAGEAVTWEEPGLVILNRPIRRGFNYVGGISLSPEFAGLLLGLIIYTGAFIAEIVRGGINAVSRGQWEASRALGLKNTTILRLVVLPQALRVIIPPMTNQYLNLTKNSSLAVAIGYPDLFNVSLTILNQTGAEVQMFVMIMLTYLTFSLVTSLIMNWYNRHMALGQP